ncbi:MULTISPECIES: PqiC family protein [Legionella]|uniref:ABC-type transport auxiliary lipoprotein component domain-containing protein n=2 Tax=Legionella maceachernii TaxID=466 RepID=A0A0W0W0M3_9GAMM|nr:PqiC family protein [Legionella maceachernii]KTD25855.1 hypothetical protein Lmac_1626 [Legionella maceachernii]SJZ47016.1 hypothetical protein SAMN02745128_00130 [Legionella maceachernii]SUP03946.1 ABC-type uncharacterized transport system, auxiliary component [Legionella maceachernii]
MRGSTVGAIILMSFMLISCGRSPDSQFYMLNPISPKQKPVKNNLNLRIGINQIQTPAYMSKPEFIIHYTSHEVKLEEYHRWVENLDKNTKRVIEANLVTLLPGATVVSAPWDYKSRPDYQLQIDISQFEVDITGNSILRAEYLIYSGNQLQRRGELYYHQKVNQVNIETLVASMNANLNHFTEDLARVFASLAPTQNNK